MNDLDESVAGDQRKEPTGDGPRRQTGPCAKHNAVIKFKAVTECYPLVTADASRDWEKNKLRYLVPPELIKIRQKNLERLKQTRGGDDWTELAHQAKYRNRNASGLHHLMSGERTFTDKAARVLEGRLELPFGWMDKVYVRDDSSAVSSEGASLEAVMAAINAAREAEGITAEDLLKKHGPITAFANWDSTERGMQSAKWYRWLLRLALKE